MGLQIARHEVFQQREWKAQRAGWVAIVLFVLAALVGLLGRGPLSWATATSQDGLVEVDYQRFTHLEADDMISIVVAPAAVTGDTVEIELAEEWLRSVEVRGMTPEPQEQVATPYGVRLTVSAEPGSEVSIQIGFRATEIGSVDAGIRFQDQTLPFDQFTYP
jgi:hypothetical protein